MSPPASGTTTSKRLANAVAVLEGVSLPVRLAALVGGSVEALKRRLPEAAQRGIEGAVRRALEGALQAAMRSDPQRNPTPLSGAWLHRGLLAASGAAGGAFGLPGTLVELPVSTTLLLRRSPPSPPNRARTWPTRWSRRNA